MSWMLMVGVICVVSGWLRRVHGHGVDVGPRRQQGGGQAAVGAAGAWEQAGLFAIELS